jgi:glycosyltransferase involved in cell wall biosynthesis
MKIAYLINQYPKVSHTFVRREIHALERLGLEVERFSIRRSSEQSSDPEDRNEEAKTHVILDSGLLAMKVASWWLLLTRPARLLLAFALCLRLGWHSERGLLRHVFYFGEACILFRKIQKLGCEHVHSHFGTNSTTVALLCRRLGGPPYSFTVHGPEEFDKPALIHLTEKIGACKFVAGVSSFGRSQLYRHCDHSQWPKVQVVHCGLDATFLQQETTPVPEAPRLVCVGRLCEQKGQLLLIEAAALVAKEGIDFELVLVGDGEMRTAVEALIAAHSLEKKIRITGWASSEVVQEELRAARVMILPSFAEGLPIVIMEALALGRPVITTYIAGIPELVESGQCGWMIPAGSVEAIKTAMSAAIAAPTAELQKMGHEGRRRVQQMHDVDRSAQQLADLFRAEKIP